MKEIAVNKKYNEKKLNTFLLEHFNGLTLNSIYKALRKKDIRVNEVRIKDNVVLHTGDIVKVFITDDQLFKNNDEINIEVIYEDDNILCVNKPKDLEVVGEDSLTSILQKQYKEKGHNFIEPCHRIDRNTTGVVLFAKNDEALRILLKKFKDREIEKHYKCLVYGILPKKQNTMTAYLFKDNHKSLVYISNIPKKGYQKIITQYKVEKEYTRLNCSLLDVTLHTGKTHQIRAHLAFIHHPIIGDGKYGSNEINKSFNEKTQLLHSYSITFRFITDSGILTYLNNKEFIKDINFSNKFKK